MGKKKGNKGNKAGKRLENPNLTSKKSTAEMVEKAQFAGDDSVGELLNNALILDESTEIVVVTNSNFQNNNEKQQMMITPPQQAKNKGKQESNLNFISDQDVGANNSNKKSTSSSRNYSCTSSGGDNSWMEKDPFEVSYSRSIEYNSVNKKGTKYVF